MWIITREETEAVNALNQGEDGNPHLHEDWFISCSFVCIVMQYVKVGAGNQTQVEIISRGAICRV
jgi:hypothetical protein